MQILKEKSAISEIKSSVDGLNYRMEGKKGRTTNLEVRTINDPI